MNAHNHLKIIEVKLEKINIKMRELYKTTYCENGLRSDINLDKLGDLPSQEMDLLHQHTLLLFNSDASTSRKKDKICRPVR